MEGPRAYRMRERPLTSEDYDEPIGWWGWNWEPPVPMSITQILSAGNLDARTAALCWLVLESHGSMLIAAEQPHSGKTTTLTALLDLLPASVRRVFIRGWAETFDYLRHTDPRGTVLLANELSSHLPVYLWGPKAIEVFRTLRRGYAFASTLHADSAEEAVAQLTGELGVEPADLARVDLLLVMRMYGMVQRFPGAQTQGPLGAKRPRRGQVEHPGPREGFARPRLGMARRVVSAHRLVSDDGSVRLVPLVEWDARRDAHEHDDAAQLELLCARRGTGIAELRGELDVRAAYLEELRGRGVLAIPAVRAAAAARRGEPAPVFDGDPLA